MKIHFCHCICIVIASNPLLRISKCKYHSRTISTICKRKILADGSRLFLIPNKKKSTNNLLLKAMWTLSSKLQSLWWSLPFYSVHWSISIHKSKIHAYFFNSRLPGKLIKDFAAFILKWIRPVFGTVQLNSNRLFSCIASLHKCVSKFSYPYITSVQSRQQWTLNIGPIENAGTQRVPQMGYLFGYSIIPDFFSLLTNLIKATSKYDKKTTSITKIHSRSTLINPKRWVKTENVTYCKILGRLFFHVIAFHHSKQNTDNGAVFNI